MLIKPHTLVSVVKATFKFYKKTNFDH